MLLALRTGDTVLPESEGNQGLIFMSLSSSQGLLGQWSVSAALCPPRRVPVTPRRPLRHVPVARAQRFSCWGRGSRQPLHSWPQAAVCPAAGLALPSRLPLTVPTRAGAAHLSALACELRQCERAAAGPPGDEDAVPAPRPLAESAVPGR